MKKSLLITLAIVLFTTLLPAHAQPGGRGMGGPPRGPRLGAASTKLFGEHTGFSATMEMQADDGSGQKVTVPGELAFLEGKSRFAMDMTRIQGGRMPPGAAEQMKAMGMGEMLSITRPDQKKMYLVYPGLESYAEMALDEKELPSDAAKFKVETSELGKETIDGHPCVKNKVIVSDDKNKHEFTTWNATDLKKFPIKIVGSEDGRSMEMMFKNVKLEKPTAGQFDPPTKFTKYDNVGTMMQEAIMKRMGGGGFSK